MTLYSLRAVVQRYNGRVVLDIDRLDLEAGRIHALLGPNGAGKTTLLNILAFLETPASGTMTFCGELVEPSPQRLLQLRRQVVLVDQHPIMFSATVSSNIEFGLKIRKVDPTVRRRKVDEALETVGLSRYKSAAAHELSGGETQRLALARALALSPMVLLCDEPTASVDAENQAIIVGLLQQINREQGTTIVFTTHDRLQAAALAQHTLVLESGRLAEVAYENSFACTFRRNNQEHNAPLHCILHGAVDIALPAPTSGRLLGPSGRLHINPEKITLCRPDAPPESGQDIVGTVVLAMAEGDKIRVVVNIGVLLAALMDRASYQQCAPQIGATVRVRFAADAITLLDVA